MPWFRFDRGFDWKPQANLTIAYRSGQVKLVTTACAQAAAAKTCGSVVKKPASEKQHGEAENSRRSS